MIKSHSLSIAVPEHRNDATRSTPLFSLYIRVDRCMARRFLLYERLLELGQWSWSNCGTLSSRSRYWTRATFNEAVWSFKKVDLVKLPKQENLRVYHKCLHCGWTSTKAGWQPLSMHLRTFEWSFINKQFALSHSVVDSSLLVQPVNPSQKHSSATLVSSWPPRAS